MKQKLLVAISFLPVSFACSQGTLVYDQQSTNLIEGAAFLRSGQPMGQSFTPFLSSIDFIELNLYDSDSLSQSGATVYLNLRSGSITGSILASTAAVFLPDGFFGTASFSFSSPITVIPGVTYYFQPLIQSGDSMGSYVTDGSYTGGTAIYQSVPIVDRDLWFREGIVIPEPGTWVLLVVGCGLLAWRSRLFW
jgi:hypothetical protein